MISNEKMLRNLAQRRWTERSNQSMKYKALKDQPQPPLPPGTGIVSLDHTDIGMGIHWSPVFLVEENNFVNYDYFSDPHRGGPFSYGGRYARRKAINYLWRRWRRGDLEYSRGWPMLLGRQCHLDYCSLGIAGNLYQYQTVRVAEAAERLNIPKSAILKIIKEHKEIKAVLCSSKTREKGYNYFHNYYQFNLAYLEAYLDKHGYGKDYPSYADRQRELGSTRKLPSIIWCV